MPLTVTLAELRAAVRDRSDTVNSSRVTDAKVNRAINSSIRRLHNKMIAAAEDELTERRAIVTVPGECFAHLPEDFLVLRDVAWDPDASVELVGAPPLPEVDPTPHIFSEVEAEIAPGATTLYVEAEPTNVVDGDVLWLYTADGTWREEVTASGYTNSGYPAITLRTPTTYDSYAPGDYAYIVRATSECDAELQPVRRFQLQERARYQSSRRSWNRGTALAYRLVGPRGNPKRIEFIPASPDSRRVVVIHYIATPQTLSADDDTYDGRSGFEEWVVWDAAIQILIAEESSVTDATRERDRVWVEDIAPLVATRDQARPDRVVDLESDDDYYEEFGL